MTALKSFRTSNCAPFYFIHYVLFMFVSAGSLAVKWVDPSFRVGMSSVQTSVRCLAKLSDTLRGCLQFSRQM